MADEKKSSTLSEQDIQGGGSMPRRSALGRLAASIAGVAALATGLRAGSAEAQGCTDSDSGANADAAGHGRRC